MKNAHLIALVSALSVLSSPALAENSDIIIEPATAGSISTEEGLEAWDRAYEVTSHPRCANCHVGPSERPMWSGPAYGKTRAHGMNVMAGESRIGAETIQCSTCHAYREGVNDIPHAAPQVAMNWQLAPIEADWFGKSSQEICTQLRDPARNGGRTMIELAEHLNHDLILHWAWNPGGGREPAPYSLQEHIDDLLIWGVAGFPCADD
ncbi:MAG: hypothetical protein OSA82_13620 [Paracoccaceae bacterium]|nr:hypothetical protein [Paracoccaceae bacterium]